MVPSAAMTRSFINPKDRAVEVARRRQEAEAELNRRREERIRQIQERSENALRRKQIGLQEKLSKNKTEAEHLLKVNKRRIEKEIQERQRIQQLVEKKRSPPRTIQTPQNVKSAIAFGSSVPRCLGVSKKSPNRSISSSSINGGGSLNNTTNSLMSRSVHPLMNSCRATARPNAKPVARLPVISKPPVKPVNSRFMPKPSHTGLDKKPIENRMTRSVHTDFYSTSNRRTEKKPTPVKPTPVKPIQTTKKASVKPIETSAAQNVTKGNAQKLKAIVVASAKSEAVKQSDEEIAASAIEPDRIDIKLEVEQQEAQPVTELVTDSGWISDLNISPSLAELTVVETNTIIEKAIEEVDESVVEPTTDSIEVDDVIEKASEEVVEAFIEPTTDSIEDDNVKESSEVLTPESAEVENVQEEQPEILTPKSIEVEDDKKPSEKSTNVETINSTASTTDIDEILNAGSADESPESVPQSEYAHNRSSSDDCDSTRTRTLTPQPVFSDDEHDSGVVPETPSPPISTIEHSASNLQTNHLFLFKSNGSMPNDTSNDALILTNDVLNGHSDKNNGSFDQAHRISSPTQVPSDPEQNSPKKGANEVNTNTLTNMSGGVVIGLTEKLQQERDNRRAKLSEILSRTREQSNTGLPVKTASDSDASTLAKNLLARRSERFNDSAIKQTDDTSAQDFSTSGNQKIASLADEFENLNVSSKQFLLPGQLSNTHNNGVSG